MPPDALASLSAWQRLLVVRALRPDRLVSAMSDFVCSTLGVESVSPAPSTLAELAAEAGPRKPLLMVTTVGADPTRDLEEAAAAAVEAGARGGEGPSGYRELAMGGGQQDEAIRMLRDAAADGGWICLKNLHLVTSWLPALQQELAPVLAMAADIGELCGRLARFGDDDHGLLLRPVLPSALQIEQVV